MTRIRREVIINSNRSGQKSSWGYGGFIIKKVTMLGKMVGPKMATAAGYAYLVLNPDGDIEFECCSLNEALDNIDTYETGESFKYRGYDIKYNEAKDDYSFAIVTKGVKDTLSFNDIIKLKRYIDDILDGGPHHA